MRVRGRYRNQTVELTTPLTLPEGTEVEVDIIVPEAEWTDEKETWQQLGMSRLEVEWTIRKMPFTTIGGNSMAIKAGDVSPTPFPFRDKSAESTRPAVVLSGTSYNQQGDVVVAAITSHPVRLSTDYALQDWKAANLVKDLTVRMLIATIDQTRIVLTIGQLTDRDWQGVQANLQLVFCLQGPSTGLLSGELT